MSKRAAEVQLTSDAVDEPDENEPGQFEVASEEQLSKRVIRKARRGRVEATESITGGGIFANIKLSNGSFPSFKSSALKSTPLLSTASSIAVVSSLPLDPASAVAPPPSSQSTFTGSPLLAQAPSSMSSAYLQQLKELNHSVSEWIAKHIKENAFVDLTPIFQDYQTHLSNIDAKYRPSEGVSPAPPSSSDGSATPPVDDDKSHDSSEHEDNESQASQTESQTSVASGAAASESSQSDPDCLHTVRAKLFYKKGDSFAELGVGTLRLEAAAPGAVRLLLRNDTALGKVLLNIRVSTDIPVSAKKNNVFVVCVANPPLSKDDGEAPVTYLVRVKTADSAEELLRVIKSSTREQ